MQNTYIDTQMPLEHSRHSESTQAPGHLWNRRLLEGRQGTQALKALRVLGHLRHTDTQALDHVGC